MPMLRFALPSGPRLLAAFGTAALFAGLGLAASRPVRSASGPIAVNVANTPLPFQHNFYLGDLYHPSAKASIVVPAHKRLVIEYVSASLGIDPPGVGGTVYLTTDAGAETVDSYLADHAQDYNKRSQSVRIYADPGTPVTVGAISQDFAAPGVGIEVSGYYVNVL